MPLNISELDSLDTEFDMFEWVLPEDGGGADEE